MVSLRKPSTLPVVGVAVDRKTYRHVLYLLLAIPLGIVYSTLLTFGVAFGLILSVVGVGVVILVATLLGSRLLAGFERWLANRLLDADLVPHDDVPDDVGGGLASVRKYVDASSTWTGLGFLSLKFWVTLFALVPVFVLANGLPLIIAPIRYPYVANFGESNGEPVTWAIDTLPEALIAVPIGIVAVLGALHAANVIAYVARRMAIALLGDRESAADPNRIKMPDAAPSADDDSDVDDS